MPSDIGAPQLSLWATEGAIKNHRLADGEWVMAIGTRAGGHRRAGVSPRIAKLTPIGAFKLAGARIFGGLITPRVRRRFESSQTRPTGAALKTATMRIRDDSGIRPCR